MQLLRVPGDLPVQRRPLTVAGACRPGPRARRSSAVARRARRLGAVVEADNLEALRGAPGRLRGPRLRRPAVRDGRAAPARLDPHRGRRADAPRASAAATYRYEVVSRPGLGGRPAARRAPRGAPRAPGRGPPRARAARLAVPARRLADGPPRAAAAGRGVRRRSGSSTRSCGRTTTAAGPRDRWPRKHDTILWYAKGDPWLFDRDAIDRVPYLAPGLVGPEKAARGKLPTDVWWMTIVPPGSRGAHRLPDAEARPAP